MTGSRVHQNAPTSYEYELSARRAALITRMSHTHRNRPDPTQPMHAAPPLSVPFLCAIVLVRDWLAVTTSCNCLTCDGSATHHCSSLPASPLFVGFPPVGLWELGRGNLLIITSAQAMIDTGHFKAVWPPDYRGRGRKKSCVLTSAPKRGTGALMMMDRCMSGHRYVAVATHSLTHSLSD